MQDNSQFEAQAFAAKELMADGVELRALKTVLETWFLSMGIELGQWRGAPVDKPYVVFPSDDPTTSVPLKEWLTYHEMINELLQLTKPELVRTVVLDELRKLYADSGVRASS